MGFQAHRSKSSSSNLLAQPEDWLVGGGEMGKLIRSMDWSKTPLGPIESWPQSLRTSVSLCLGSNFPISLVWGPKHVQIYNDGYWPICGGKHPNSMGQDFNECWAAPWTVIGEAFERALAGETSHLENQRLFLDRNGYLEETCFTFSFSPIRDETGGVGGLFHPVTETTGKMLSERRTRGLRELAARAGKAETMEAACTLVTQTLAEYEEDLPFVLFYLFDAAGKEARLTASTGLPAGTVASPVAVDLQRPERDVWQLGEFASSSRTQHFTDLEERVGPFLAGPYPESVKEGLALPIVPPGCAQPVGVLVLGVSTRLPLNEDYLTFYDLLAAVVTTVVANARAYEEEGKRAEALAEIDRAKTAFFSNVSHEFRTPLTLILGPLEDELAERSHPLPKARHERLEAAHRNSLRLLKLVNTLLDFSRIEAGRVQANYEPTDLALQTAELASVFRSAVEKAGLSLRIDCQPLPEAMYIDREMWEKIVLNLLSNAFKHTFYGGILVKLSWCGDHAELAVADSGVGIPEVELPSLFERFHRVTGAKSRTHEGTGIGLALVRELVSLHGGTVRVESEEHKGSTFTVTIKAGTAHLPLDRVSAKRDLDSTTTRATAYVDEALQWLPDAVLPSEVNYGLAKAAITLLQPGSAPPPGAKRAKILWADDNSDMRDYVSRLLAAHYDVVPVPDGVKALAAAMANPFDLVLSDVMMPGLDGFGLLRELRKNARTKSVPVILLSARAGEESAIEGMDAGADDYLVKPFSARELLARVRTHLELARDRQAWAKELEQANRELETSNKELEAFSRTVSHDLRAPLATVHGFAELLEEKYAAVLGEQPRKYLQRITEAVVRMSSLIDDLLKLSKVNRQELMVRDVALGALVEEVRVELEGETISRKIEWRIGALPVIQCDRGLMKQVFVNLLSNAIKYTRPRDPAVIEIRQEIIDGEPAILVRDNGVGFDSKRAEKLFTPFQRFHRAEEFEGTGVGLATVQRIIDKHRGRIWAHAESQKGSSFYFTVGSEQSRSARAAHR